MAGDVGLEVGEELAGDDPGTGRIGTVIGSWPGASWRQNWSISGVIRAGVVACMLDPRDSMPMGIDRSEWPAGAG
ncbi:hypothetical protein ElP_35560 [Tautonia plasticadhaerens]|uniref:Uncharacterized protein n=1 Tax=Tautonia plasticadhaerens TaxID=2527974 RepID=A0A518H487_9BACT|nr:hypothetical protein ElP_35560 [Tautonia plasticadhaerens]